MKDDVITIPRAEYDMLANHAHLINTVEQLCKCSGYYTAATFLRHMCKSCMLDNLDDAPGMDTLVTLDRAEYDNLNRVTGLLNALIAVSKRASTNFELNSLVEMLFCGDEKVDKG